MLYYDRDRYGITTYTVTNDQGLCLIRTTNGMLATYVDARSRGIPPELRLRVGGDRGTPGEKHIWTHIRRFTKS
jgi:hypothetical protein